MWYYKVNYTIIYGTAWKSLRSAAGDFCRLHLGCKGRSGLDESKKMPASCCAAAFLPVVSDGLRTGRSDPGAGGIFFNLLAQPIDIYHNGIFIDDRLAPDNTVDHILGKNVINVVYE